MNPFYLVICGPAILAMLLMFWLISWLATAPYKAAQTVQKRKME